MSKTLEINPPKAGSKLARLVSVLTKRDTSLRTLSKSLAWQEHTVRAAITRLRQRGYDIERVSEEGRRTSKYRIRG